MLEKEKRLCLSSCTWRRSTRAARAAILDVCILLNAICCIITGLAQQPNCVLLICLTHTERQTLSLSLLSLSLFFLLSFFLFRTVCLSFFLFISSEYQSSSVLIPFLPHTPFLSVIICIYYPKLIAWRCTEAFWKLADILGVIVSYLSSFGAVLFAHFRRTV